MIVCLLALAVFSIMAVFSAKYRPLAREAFRCVFLRLTLRPCEAGLDQRIKASLVSKLLPAWPPAARFANRNFEAISWAIALLSIASFAYSAYGVYNFYYFGNCNGPGSVSACIFNDIAGDYGRFSAPGELVPPESLDGIAQGNPNASIQIIEFGCFTCPYTAKAESTMQSLLEKYNGSIYYVFKPFPRPNRALSFDMARAVLCAQRQGMHKKLRQAIFSQQETCLQGGIPAISSVAEGAGLDMTRFNSCFNGNETGAELAKYVEQGRASRIYSTPTFFVNGKPLVGQRPAEEFERLIKGG